MKTIHRTVSGSHDMHQMIADMRASGQSVEQGTTTCPACHVKTGYVLVGAATKIQCFKCKTQLRKGAANGGENRDAQTWEIDKD